MPLRRLAVALVCGALGLGGCARPDAGAGTGIPAAEGPLPPAHFDCGGRAVAAQLGDGAITLVFAGGETVVLPEAPSEAGALFQRADTLFRMRDDGARLALGRPEVACAVVGDDRPAGEDVSSADARLFRGIGQEPGWTVEVFPDRIAFVGDYGERTLTVLLPAAERVGTRTRYRAQTGAHVLTLTIDEEPCRDAMSGEPYPATVTVDVDGDRYVGCGG